MRQRLNLLLLLVLVVAIVPFLASCAGPEVKVPDKVRVPVPVACVKPEKRPQRPELASAADLLAMDEGTRTLRAWAQLKRQAVYIGELEAVVEGCSRIPAAAPP